MPTDPTLNLIDRALAIHATSEDAMRWPLEPEATNGTAVLGAFLAALDLRRRFQLDQERRHECRIGLDRVRLASRATVPTVESLACRRDYVPLSELVLRG